VEGSTRGREKKARKIWKKETQSYLYRGEKVKRRAEEGILRVRTFKRRQHPTYPKSLKMNKGVGREKGIKYLSGNTSK